MLISSLVFCILSASSTFAWTGPSSWVCEQAEVPDDGAVLVPVNSGSNCDGDVALQDKRILPLGPGTDDAHCATNHLKDGSRGGPAIAGNQAIVCLGGNAGGNREIDWYIHHNCDTLSSTGKDNFIGRITVAPGTSNCIKPSGGLDKRIMSAQLAPK